MRWIIILKTEARPAAISPAMSSQKAGVGYAVSGNGASRNRRLLVQTRRMPYIRGTDSDALTAV